ncbi:MAG TPA: RNA polymerase sigma-70 factor [Chitinophagaceae bacterium]|nr:RNA polymerase sigma-70 factor [Chitinophagaceae bacterium]
MSLYNIYNDKELFDLLRTEDVTAFTEIYNRYWKKLYVTANAILNDDEAARDIIQNVFISLWERRQSAEIEFPAAYLQQATRFQVFKAIRASKADASFYRRLTDVSATIIFEKPLLFKELLQLLHKILEELPEDQRRAFLLNRNDGLSYREIAAEMNISTKTVEKKISNTLKSLRIGFNEAFVLVGILLTIINKK